MIVKFDNLRMEIIHCLEHTLLSRNLEFAIDYIARPNTFPKYVLRNQFIRFQKVLF